MALNFKTLIKRLKTADSIIRKIQILDEDEKVSKYLNLNPFLEQIFKRLLSTF
ncbi:MAG: hypothetical protein KR126chlam6_00543 [Candidatus Anoxychlamydiales bacterium]|nr:hypothetical protein [Candidatus Anoxychlamydiales bacterium]